MWSILEPRSLISFYCKIWGVVLKCVGDDGDMFEVVDVFVIIQDHCLVSTSSNV
jgi:hypothetical protein